MLFVEYSFLFLFLPLALLAYYGLGRRRNLVLLLASCVFYATSSLQYLPILLASVLVDFLAGRGIARARSKGGARAWLALSLLLNLGALAYFKYAGFITQTLRQTVWPGAPYLWAALPVGISFFTFQSMSYTIDVYRRRLEPVRSLVDFGAYVTMFPQLIAGPIVRFAELQRQLRAREHTWDRFAQGLALFVVGLGKKLLLADTFAWLAAPLFLQDDPSFATAWVSMLLFAGQIYFDFSGYSDMAIGLGRLFGFELPTNFRSPYKATSFSDFWRRWHITLSTWLRDYLYVSLGGNRKGAFRTYVNLMLTMLLGGLWHGASWSFVLWGALHGGYLVVERILRGRLPAPPTMVRHLLVFVCVVVAWVPFKHDGLAEALTWLSAMANPLAGLGVDPVAALGALGVLAAVWLPRSTDEWRLDLSPRQTVFLLFVFALSLFVGFGRVEASPFLYFRF